MNAKDPFAHITDQPAVTRVLTRALERPHAAYLLVGGPLTGATTIAETFVRALLKTDTTKPLAAHPDLVWIGRERGEEGTLTGLSIPIASVRQARTRLSVRPVTAPRLVAYVPEADRLGTDGADVLLKAMEEPLCDTVFVLVAREEARVPDTVKSRLIRLVLHAPTHREPSTDPEARVRTAEAARLIDAALQASSDGQVIGLFDAEFRRADAADDTTDAWRATCDELARAVGDRLADAPVPATRLARALIAARRNVGGPVSPRLWFEQTFLGERVVQ